MAYKEIHTIIQFNKLIEKELDLRHMAFQNLDFTQANSNVKECTFEDCIFLGCTLPDTVRTKIDASSLIFPKIKVPYNVYRSQLYNAYDLYKGYSIDDPSTFDSYFDAKVYEHYLRTGKHANDIKETLARSLHDHSMTDAMYDFLEKFDEQMIVGIMGGHGLLRTDPIFRQIVGISKELTERGFLMVSGGGPGAMEATHLGAWMAGRTQEEVDEAIAVVSSAPSYHDEGWLHTALVVVRDYPQKNYYSLGIPTWLYGHEPSTPFATHIAKYFENAIREDGILTIAKGGVIYTPGSAGTMQEIFQDAVQNHYLSFGYASPMIFLGKEYWTKEMPVYTLLENLLQEGRYKNLMLSLTDESQDIIDLLTGYPFGKEND